LKHSSELGLPGSTSMAKIGVFAALELSEHSFAFAKSADPERSFRIAIAAE